MKMNKVHHNKRKCIGCGGCALVAKSNFEMDKSHGKANLKNPIQEKNEIYTALMLEEEIEKNEKAAKLCPVNAIRIEKD